MSVPRPGRGGYRVGGLDRSNSKSSGGAGRNGSANGRLNESGRASGKGRPRGTTPPGGSAGGLPKWAATLLGLTAVGFLLYACRPILLPLALAGLLAFLLAPLCEWLEHRRVPRVAATVAVVLLAATVLLGVGVAVYVGASSIANQETIEAYTERLKVKAAALPFAGGGPGIITDLQEAGAEVGEAMGERVQEAGEAMADASGGDGGGDDDDDAGDGAADADAEPTPQQLLAERLDEISRRLVQRQTAEESAVVAAIDALGERVTVAVDEAADRVTDQPLSVREISTETGLIDRIGLALAYVAGPIGVMGLVAVFLLFILLQRDDLRDRVIKLAAGREINLATQALDDASRRIARYLGAQCLVNGTYGVAITLGLLAIGYFVGGGWFPGVILWGILCFALRFIPYLGPWLAASFPILVSLGHFDGYAVFATVLGMFVVIELLSNNVMEPMLYGSAVGMSDFAVIIAATVWTFLWGPVGLLVATPLTTCLVVLGKHVPALGFINTLLGDEEVLSPDTRLYQRLLAMDADDAAEELEEYRKTHTLTETYDDLLLPALALGEGDREAGALTDERSDFIRATMHDLVQQLAEQEGPLPSDSVDSDGTAGGGTAELSASVREVPVAILPAKDEADETAAEMLKALLDRRGFPTTVVGDEVLVSEKLTAVTEARAELVVVSALPPGAVTGARYLIKRLDASGLNIDIPIVVGLWGARGDLERAEKRITGHVAAKSRDPANAVDRRHVRLVRDLATAAETVRNRAEVIAARKPSVTKPLPAEAGATE